MNTIFNVNIKENYYMVYISMLLISPYVEMRGYYKYIGLKKRILVFTKV
jgi:hypothetical protein